MADEMVHGSVGTSLTQVEFEAVGLHVLNSQATGDVIYASSTTQLSRLAKGAANTVLVMGASIPAWSATLAGLTLTSPTINGTIATTGLTLPAVTLGGAVTLSSSVGGNGSNVFSNISEIQCDYVHSKTWAGPLYLGTGNAASDAFVNRLAISGALATAVATWANVTHTGIVLSGALNANSQAITAIGGLTINGGVAVATSVTDSYLIFCGGNSISGGGAYYAAYGHTIGGVPGAAIISTTNAAGNANVDRLNIAGAAATATATWAATTHTGIVLSGALTLNAQVFDAGAVGAEIDTTAAGTSYASLMLKSTQDAADGASLQFRHVSASPANDDAIGIIQGVANDDGSALRVYNSMEFLVEDVTAAGGWSGKIYWYNYLDGVENQAMTLSGAGALWTDASVDTLLYKVSGTQVVGARVVDARCDDVVDATYGAEEAGVLDALRDAMITHGLIAAA